MRTFYPQVEAFINDYRFTLSAYQCHSFDEAMHELHGIIDNLINAGIQPDMGTMIIDEIIRSEYESSDEYNIDSDLSDKPYNERKSISDKFVQMICHFIDKDFKESGAMITLTNGDDIFRDGVDENYECYNVGDKVITDDGDHAIVVWSPGMAYSTPKWRNEYEIEFEDGNTRSCGGDLLAKEEYK